MSRGLRPALLATLFLSQPVDAASPSAPQPKAPSQPALACVYAGLGNGGTQSCSVTPMTFNFTQNVDSWGAVGVRSQGTDDWDIRLYDVEAPEPACAATILGGSTATTGVDIVVGDYNHSPLGDEWATVDRFAGLMPGKVEWDGGAEQIYANGPYTTRDTGTDDILEAWDIVLEEGQTYTFEFGVTSGSAACQLLLFRNPANAPYWASRAARVLETNTTTTYTAPATDVYGLVVVNDNGSTGTYRFRVKTCVSSLFLTSGNKATVTPPSTAYDFTQPGFAIYWSAVGVRHLIDDWDISVHAGVGPGPFPNCFTSPLAASTYALNVLDFVVGDFSANPRTTYWVDAYPFRGSATPADLEWDDSDDQIGINGEIVSRTTGPNDVLEVWDVHMFAGRQYTIEFVPSGAANLVYHVFQNTSPSPYWAARAQSVHTGTGTSTWTTANTGYKGLVVTNDNGAPGSYTLRVGWCAPAQALSSATIAPLSGSVGYYSFNQLWTYWSAVGVRQQSADWDLDVWQTGSGGAWSTCFTNMLANSTGNGTVDFVIGDFNHNPLGTYYVRPYRDAGPYDSNLEWDSGGDQIDVNTALVQRTTGPTDVLEVWDVLLNAGVSYDFYFERHGTAATKLLLFRNTGATFWAPRSSRVIETTATNISYTAPATDYYALVVVNDNGQAGSYRLGLATSVSDADGDIPAVTALQHVGPNPSHGAVEIGFDLREPASIGIQVIDVAGRLVASLPRRDWPAGRWATSWDGSDAGGRRAGAGVYYVRVSAADREIGQRKIVLLQ